MFGTNEAGLFACPPLAHLVPPPPPRPHQYGPDGTCWKCTLHFLDTTGPCPGLPA